MLIPAWDYTLLIYSLNTLKFFFQTKLHSSLNTLSLLYVLWSSSAAHAATHLHGQILLHHLEFSLELIELHLEGWVPLQVVHQRCLELLILELAARLEVELILHALLVNHGLVDQFHHFFFVGWVWLSHGQSLFHLHFRQVTCQFQVLWSLGSWEFWSSAGILRSIHLAHHGSLDHLGSLWVLGVNALGVLEAHLVDVTLVKHDLTDGHHNVII